jgi:hypothetical protein
MPAWKAKRLADVRTLSASSAVSPSPVAVDAFKTPLIVDSRFGDVQSAGYVIAGPGSLSGQRRELRRLRIHRLRRRERRGALHVLGRHRPVSSASLDVTIGRSRPRGTGRGATVGGARAERTAHEGKPAFCGWDSARTARRDREMRAFAAIPRTEVRLLPEPLVAVEGLSHAQRIFHMLGDKRLSWVVIGVVI